MYLSEKDYSFSLTFLYGECSTVLTQSGSSGLLDLRFSHVPNQLQIETAIFVTDASVGPDSGKNCIPAVCFFDCTDFTHESALTVSAAENDDYSYLEAVARNFRRWITVSWLEFCEIVRTIIRIFCDSIDRAAFKRNTYIREGVFRL